MFKKTKLTAALMLLLAPALINSQVMHVPLDMHENSSVDMPNSVKSALQQGIPQLSFNLEQSGTAKFTGQFYIGSKLSPAKLILDSNSDWLFVESEQCENCKPNHRVYNPKTSTTMFPGDNEAYTAMYESLYVVGDDVYDRVCVADKLEDREKYCVKNFRFLSVIDVHQRMTPMDGMLGLGPDDPSNGPSYVAALYNAGKIGRKMFGLAYGKGLKSQITFGGWDERFKRTIDDEIYFFPQTNETRWEIDVRDMKMSDNSFWVSTRKAVIDTFFRAITLPDPEFLKFKKFIEGISPSINCDTNTRICQSSGKCVTKVNSLPQLRLQFGSKQTFSVNPSDYLDDRNNQDTGFKDVCVLMIQGTDKDYMQIGQSFLFNYYTIFDFEKSRVGFFLLSTTNSQVNLDGVERAPLDNGKGGNGGDKKFPPWAIALIVLVIVGIFVAIGVVMFVKRRNRKLAENLAEYNQLEGTGRKTSVGSTTQ